MPLAIAIGIQNVPEGFATAAPLVAAGARSIVAVGFAAATGARRAAGRLRSLGAFDLVSGLLPAGLAFAAGAMLYVVVDELVPESHARKREREGTLALTGGLGLMMGLDNAF